MKVARAIKSFFVVGILAALVAFLPACSNVEDSVAATVGSHEIKEGAVTAEIQRLRSQVGLTDDSLWGQYLAQSNVTPESLRETVINYLVEKYVVLDAASELGVSVTEEEIDAAIDSFKQNYPTDKAWQAALEQAGFTEETYRENVSSSMIERAVSNYFIEQTSPTEEDYLDAAKQYAAYYDGAKRSSHILIAVSDTNNEEAWAEAKTKADQILQQIKSGSLSFEDAVAQYSDDTGSKANGGDVGWDKMSQFITEYTDGLNQLEVGEISPEPVQSTYGYHIIMCTEKFTAPEEGQLVSIEQIPAASQDEIKQLATRTQASNLYSEWINEIKETIEIVINPMPKGLPYDVDMSQYEGATPANDGTYSLETGNPEADEAFGGASEEEAIMNGARDAETNPDGSAVEEVTVEGTSETTN